MGDGRRELDRQVPGADVMFVDAYFADSLPFHLVTKEFFELCRRKLPPDGVLSMNFGGDLTGRRNALFWAAVKTVGLVFPRIVHLLVRARRRARATFERERDPHRDAIRPTASTRPRSPTGPPCVAEKLARPPVAEWAARLYEGELKIGDVPVLTDAYAPTDALQNLSR